MLEVEGEAEDTVKKVINLQEDIKRHVKQYSLKSFRTKGTQMVNISTMNKRRRSDEDLSDGSATGGAEGVNGADCAELRAHGYEVEPQAKDIVDPDGKYVLQALCRVWHPLYTYTPR
jgi:hypothetical protein